MNDIDRIQVFRTAHELTNRHGRKMLHSMHSRLALLLAVSSICWAADRKATPTWLNGGHCTARSIREYNNGRLEVLIIFYEVVLQDLGVAASIQEELPMTWQKPSLGVGQDFSYVIESSVSMRVRDSGSNVKHGMRSMRRN